MMRPYIKYETHLGVMQHTRRGRDIRNVRAYARYVVPPRGDLRVWCRWLTECTEYLRELTGV